MAKRKRGLGETIEEHLSRVTPAAVSAKSAMHAAVILAEKGKCRAALQSLLGGHQDLGVSLIHSHGEPNYQLDSLLEERSKYQKAFAQKCLVGGGLSGLKRRKARR